jgi:hypothetical protein
MFWHIFIQCTVLIAGLVIAGGVVAAISSNSAGSGKSTGHK